MANTPRRPSRGITLAMWEAYDKVKVPLTLELVDTLCTEHGWPRSLARSHAKQWIAAGGKGTMPTGKAARTPRKPKEPRAPKAPKEPSLKARKERKPRVVKEPKASTAPSAVMQHATAVPAVKPPPPPVRPEGLPQRICGACGGAESLKCGRCESCGSKAELRALEPGEVLPTRRFLALGPHCWGMGANPEVAGRNLLKSWPSMIPHAGSTCQLWDVPRSAYVDMQGRIGYDQADAAPVLVLERTL